LERRLQPRRGPGGYRLRRHGAGVGAGNRGRPRPLRPRGGSQKRRLRPICDTAPQRQQLGLQAIGPKAVSLGTLRSTVAELPRADGGVPNTCQQSCSERHWCYLAEPSPQRKSTGPDASPGAGGAARVCLLPFVPSRRVASSSFEVIQGQRHDDETWTTSSNLLDWITGNSTGFAPFRIRPA
jgi:hypothetical protein